MAPPTAPSARRGGRGFGTNWKNSISGRSFGSEAAINTLQTTGIDELNRMPMEAELPAPMGWWQRLAVEHRRGITKIYLALAAGRVVTRHLVAGANGPQRDASLGRFMRMLTIHDLLHGIAPVLRKGVLSRQVKLKSILNAYNQA